MIKITIELFPPFSRTPKLLASGKIWNDLSGDKSNGNYKYELNLKRKQGWRTGSVSGFKRNQLNVWFLLKEIIKEL